MTAVIGISNKNAIAIAADSAVTVSGDNGRKIYNTANKIFTLSKFHPVSITIYSSSDFLRTPWEIIIKIYRKELEEKSFPTLEDYANDFFKFLKDKDFFCSQKDRVEYFESFIYAMLQQLERYAIESAVEDEHINLITLSEDERTKIFHQKIIDFLKRKINDFKEEEQLKDFKYLTQKKFKEIGAEIITKMFEDEFDGINTRAIKNLFVKLIFHFIKSKSFHGSWTGLVFAGYGESEIYPVTISTKVSGVFDEKVRFYTEHVRKIDDYNTGSIMPFAQRDVIDTLISGISPGIDETLFLTFNQFLKDYNNLITELIEEASPELATKIRSIDTYELCERLMDEIKEVKFIKHIDPTVSTVSVLSKEDLSELAESLIYLTYLRRRMSSDEESVGGPVDVAIISKGDGFIWIKRKHYFDQKYNPNFIKNYYRT